MLTCNFDEETTSNIVPLRSISFLPQGSVVPEELRIDDIWFYDLPVVTVGYQDFTGFDIANAPVNGSVNEIADQFEDWLGEEVEPGFVPGLGSIRASSNV